MLAHRFLPKKISEIRPSDSRVALMGSAVSVGESSFVLDDGSGRADIYFENPPKQGDLIRAFCVVVEGKLKAEAVQSLNGLDLNVYQKAQEMYRKVGL